MSAEEMQLMLESLRALCKEYRDAKSVGDERIAGARIVDRFETLDRRLTLGRAIPTDWK